MPKYRGARGKRDYKMEARDLGRFAVGMAAVCVVAVALAVGMFFFTRDMGDYAVPVLAVVEDREILPVFSAVSHEWVDLPPLIPMYWGAGVFFDPVTYKIILPYDVRIAGVWHNYLRYIYEITLEGIYLPTRRIPLFALDALPFRIIQGGDNMHIRTRSGALVRYGRNASYGYIQIIDPREKYHTIVIIDPGHGGSDPGALSANGRNAPSESEIVLDITLKLLEIFDEPGILLLPTRTSDVFLDNAYRYLLANELGDYFISIHCNADVSRFSQGTLTLYGCAPGSYELAYAFQNSLIDALGSQDRGVHHAPQFRILNSSQIPVALLELMFISNPQEATRLADPYVQMLIAQTLADTISTLPPAR